MSEILDIRQQLLPEPIVSRPRDQETTGSWDENGLEVSAISPPPPNLWGERERVSLPRAALGLSGWRQLTFYANAQTLTFMHYY